MAKQPRKGSMPLYRAITLGPSLGSALGVVLVPLVLVGCAKPSRQGLDSPIPSARIVASAKAAQAGDMAAIPHLIRMLGSDDPLVRMMSQHALDRLTGQTLGYFHADRDSKRAEAIGRWVAWQETQDTQHTQVAQETADSSVDISVDASNP